MKNVMDALLNSWFALLDGNLSFDSREVKVYPTDADNSDDFHHVIIRAESETDESNKTSFVTKAVVIIEIVTVHSVSINKSVANNIDNQVRELLFPTRHHNLPALNGLQITNVIPQGGSYLDEDDGTKKYYRKVTRYNHRITQI